MSSPPRHSGACDRGSAPIDPGAIPPALTGGEFQLVASDVGDLWISRQDEVMRPYLARKGTWEAAEGRLLRTYIKPGCRFLDVGANIGYFSLLAARSASGVVVDAVQPHRHRARAAHEPLDRPGRRAASSWSLPWVPAYLPCPS